jgi:uncharacterized protein
MTDRREKGVTMLTEAMRTMVNHQRLGYVATVGEDGTPNLSPKGTVAVWDDEHVVFLDIRSPRTMRNLRHNPVTEINVVDPFTRKGYRFKGRAQIVEPGPELDEIVAFYRERNVTNPVRAAVLVHVERALEVTSPSYDDPDADEAAIRERYIAWYTAGSTQGVEQP